MPNFVKILTEALVDTIDIETDFDYISDFENELMFAHTEDLLF